MDISNPALIQMLLASILTPALMAPMGDTVAAILAQDGFPALLNDVIAWLILLVFAFGSVFAANQFTPNLPGLADVLIGAVFLLVNGGIGKLRPYLAGLDWIQSNVFDVARGTDGKVDVQRLNAGTLVTSVVNALMPEIERLFQTHTKAVQQSIQESQPVALDAPISFPGLGIQDVPQHPLSGAANQMVSMPPHLAALAANATQAQPSGTATITQFPSRNWNDSNLMQAVPPQPPQGH